MTREQMFSAAAATMSAAVSVATIYVAPILESSPELKILALVGSLPGFYLVFQAALWVIGHYQYRSVLGTWYYSTTPYQASSFQDGNFGKMRVSLDSANDLAYSVQLFESFDDLMSDRKARLRGIARSDAVRYDVERGDLKILYHVEYNTDGGKNPARFGRLFLSLTEDKTLLGHWVSDIDKTVISSGVMFAARPQKFADELTRIRPQEVPETENVDP